MVRFVFFYRMLCLKTKSVTCITLLFHFFIYLNDIKRQFPYFKSSTYFGRAEFRIFIQSQSSFCRYSVTVFNNVTTIFTEGEWYSLSM